MRKHELVNENIELWRILNGFVELHKAIQKDLEYEYAQNSGTVVRRIRRTIEKHKILIPQVIYNKLDKSA